jgi:hypothetical protein
VWKKRFVEINKESWAKRAQQEQRGEVVLYYRNKQRRDRREADFDVCLRVENGTWKRRVAKIEQSCYLKERAFVFGKEVERGELKAIWGSSCRRR